jgi:predicted dehydrogenase
MEASPLHCTPSGSVRALIEHPEVDVVYYLTPQWFGSFPFQIACEAKKPIYCALPVTGFDLGSMAELIRSTKTPFMIEMARRFYPATLRLQELLATKLGRPRMILGHSRLFGFDRYGTPGPTTQTEPAPLAIDPGSYLLDWCRYLFQEEPNSVQAVSGNIMAKPGEDPDFLSFCLKFASGQVTQLSCARYHRNSWGEASRFLPQPGFQVYAERGLAWVEMPDRIHWSDPEGNHEERLPMEPSVGEVLNDHFHRMVTGEPSLAPDLDAALSVSKLLNKMLQSLQAGRAVGTGGADA